MVRLITIIILMFCLGVPQRSNGEFTTPPPETKSMPKVDSEKHCCGCVYQERADGTLCEFLSSQQACVAPPESANQNWVCGWDGTKCINLHEAACKNFIKTQVPKCDWSKIQPTFPPDIDLLVNFPPGCTAQSTFYSGHGLPSMCTDYLSNVQDAILGAEEGCLTINFDSNACLLFARTDEALTQAQTICLLSGKKCTVSANQCNGMANADGCEAGEHSTRLKICIEGGVKPTVTPLFPVCKKEDSTCPGQIGQSQKCRNSENAIKTQTCCPKKIVGPPSPGEPPTFEIDYVWLNIDQCPPISGF